MKSRLKAVSKFTRKLPEILRAGEEFIQQRVVPSSTAVLRGEELEALQEHQIVVAGALSHLHWSDLLSFSRKSEVALSFRRD